MRADPAMHAHPARTPRRCLRAFLRDDRGAAAIELALGAVVFVAVAALTFDLYARIKADTSAARVAVTMADYVSRDPAPNGDDLAALGGFLHAHELRVPADLVYVLTAFRQPPADEEGALPAVERLWTDDTIRIGDETVTGNLADDCSRRVGAGGVVNLPGDFTMAAGEVLVVAEVCARLTREGSITGRFLAGDLYRLHALPARDPEEPPAPPEYAPPADGTPA